MTGVFATVLSGVLVFVLGQVFLKMILEPVNKLKQTIASVSHAYLLHAPVFFNPVVSQDDEKKKTREQFRLLSGQLYADANRHVSRVFGLPSWEKVHESAQCLVAIGNWLFSGNTATIEHILKNWQQAADNLGLYIAPADRVDDELLNQAIRNALGRRDSAQPSAPPDVPAAAPRRQGRE